MNVGAESYSASWQLNKPCQTFSVSKVIKSNNPAFAVGDHVSGPTGWEVYTVTDGKSGTNKIQEIPGVPISIYLGVLGGPGLTAYIGLYHFCSPMKPGETRGFAVRHSFFSFIPNTNRSLAPVYVNAAAGAVGTVVGQIGKAIGLRVVGSAGSDDKVKLLKELGFDEAFNYKTGSLDENLKRTCRELIGASWGIVERLLI
jgi:NADPH-dependent curcumin reductase CurA